MPPISSNAFIKGLKKYYLVLNKNIERKINLLKLKNIYSLQIFEIMVKLSSRPLDNIKYVAQIISIHTVYTL